MSLTTQLTKLNNLLLTGGVAKFFSFHLTMVDLAGNVRSARTTAIYAPTNDTNAIITKTENELVGIRVPSGSVNRNIVWQSRDDTISVRVVWLGEAIPLFFIIAKSHFSA